MLPGLFVIRADATGGGSNTAFRTVVVEFSQIISNCATNDDDCDDDGVSLTFETIPSPLPDNLSEEWLNGEVHEYFFTARSIPNNVDSDNDGLPDGLELGIGPGPAAANTDLNADFDGDGFKNFTPDSDPPKYNTVPDNSGLSGFDWSRDIMAFYARDGGLDGKYYFRVDFHELAANAEQGFLDVYVVIDTGNPSVGEINLPDEVDGKTDMRWEVVVAAYNANNGTVYVRNPGTGIVEARGYTPTGNGFRGSYYRGDLDFVEIAVARQALLDAGWNGASPLQFQVFSTKDGNQNPSGAGDIGGRIDITDSIFDDDIAESDTQAPKDTLKFWFTSINSGAFNLGSFVTGLTQTNRPSVAKVAVLLHGNQAILPASVLQNLVSNHVTRTPVGTFAPLDPGNQPTGYHRALETHTVFGMPVNLHLSGSLVSGLQWAESDAGLDPNRSRSGPKFNQRIKSLVQSNQVMLTSGMFADHIAPYFTGVVNRTAIRLQDDITKRVFGDTSGTANSPVYLAERVADGTTMSDLAAQSGHNYVVLDQMVHLWWWAEQLYGFGNGRLTAIGNSGYQINRFNGMNAFLISGASDQMYLNNDFGATVTLRELLLRKAMSGTKDQVVILSDNWETMAGIGGNSNPDKYNLVARWLANHPWIKPVLLDKYATGQVDINNDGSLNGSDFPFVVDRGAAAFGQQSKDFVRHNSRTNYHNWYYGLASAEESFFDKFPPLRSGIFGNKKLGHVRTNNTVLADAWTDVTTATGSLSNLSALVYLNGIFETAFHDEDNSNFDRFSTGDYKFPDTTGFDTLIAFAHKPNSRVTRQAGIAARAAVWAANPPALTQAVTEDVDHDGESEYVLKNPHVYAVFEAIGGRLLAAFARDATTSNAFQMVGNLVNTPEFEDEQEGASNLSGTAPLAYRTSGFKDWFAVTNTPSGAGTTQYVNNVYSTLLVANGWQFTSSDGKIVKTITLGNTTNRLAATYSLSGGITKLFVRHGFAPDALNLIADGQANLIGPTVAAGKVSLLNSNLTVQATVAVILSNITYNAAATDKDAAGFVSVTMRYQAQTHQIELESTNTVFSFAIEFNASECASDADNDGLNVCAELGLGTNPNNPDTDGDTMNDGWEATYRDPLDPGNANADPDGDGATDFQESVAGTDPDDQSSVMRITSIVPVGSHIVIIWSSVPGKSYQVLTNANLTTAFSLLSGVIPSGGASTVYTNTSPTGTTKFYKVLVLP